MAEEEFVHRLYQLTRKKEARLHKNVKKVAVFIINND
jgi:hypothetical protein